MNNHFDRGRLLEVASRAAHKAQDRRERSENLHLILGEPDATFERIARFVAWADVHAEDQVEVAVNAVLDALAAVSRVNEKDLQDLIEAHLPWVGGCCCGWQGRTGHWKHVAHQVFVAIGGAT